MDNEEEISESKKRSDGIKFYFFFLLMVSVGIVILCVFNYRNFNPPIYKNCYLETPSSKLPLILNLKCDE